MPVAPSRAFFCLPLQFIAAVTIWRCLERTPCWLRTLGSAAAAAHCALACATGAKAAAAAANVLQQLHLLMQQQPASNWMGLQQVHALSPLRSARAGPTSKARSIMLLPPACHCGCKLS